MIIQQKRRLLPNGLLAIKLPKVNIYLLINKGAFLIPSKDETTSNVKQQIIQAAIQLFAEKGYYKTTTAGIANAVGVTQPYVFHFFRNKEQLYLAVLEQAIRRVFQAL
ncbi:TetR/AcrR family transcriptional regulator [Paenibacillus sedimenti]|uniref:TetR/AcrR family transcriptional regulator n=1 Tax=Paenibacillus sedimenti TaxID=2770274 RepID=A0A926QN47_9BACL|nr:TetR/AcrR family transcriptional regulator [Paenibacillus sedimenti]MBD0384387.1 TetR/AcrR family transcriptional regulator [Paenibacillus sedimenti]